MNLAANWSAMHGLKARLRGYGNVISHFWDTVQCLASLVFALVFVSTSTQNLFNM